MLGRDVKNARTLFEFDVHGPCIVNVFF